MKIRVVMWGEIRVLDEYVEDDYLPCDFSGHPKDHCLARVPHRTPVPLDNRMLTT